MRQFGGFLALSGAVWLGGLLVLDVLDGEGVTWLFTLATWGAPVVVVGTVATLIARTRTQVTLVLTALWLLTATVAFVGLSASLEPSLILANAVLLYVSIPYVAWLTFPLVVASYLADRGAPATAHR